MNAVSDGKQVFSEKKASEILQKAARLQEEKGGSYAPGITHEDMVRIATEAGIEPQYIDAAIKSLSNKETRKSFLNLIEEEERVIDGELDPSEFDVIFEAVKPSRMRRGGAQQVGRTLSMQTFYKGNFYHVEISSRNGRTRILVKSIPFTPYFFSLHPTLIAALIGFGNFAGHGNLLVGSLFALSSLAVGLSGFGLLARRGTRKTAELADKIEDCVSKALGELRGNLATATSVVEPTAPTQEITQTGL
jgi:hypothetical protein